MTVARAAQDEVEEVRREMQEKVKGAQEAADRQVGMGATLMLQSHPNKKSFLFLSTNFSGLGEGAGQAAPRAAEGAGFHPG